MATRTGSAERWGPLWGARPPAGVYRAPMGLAVLAGPEREDDVRRQIVEALAPFRGDDGRYRLRNEFHSVIAKKS